MSFLTIRTKFFANQLSESEIDKLLREIEEEISSNSYIPSSFNREKILERIKEINGFDSLSGKIYAIKDLISNTDGIVTGGSRFLENYKPPINSTIYKTLKDCGLINVVNTNLDEFGLGGTGLNSSLGIVSNPVNDKYISGGSSSGSAYLISKNLIEFSIVSDTGDSARQPASYCGVFGFKPSFGKISRFGFYPFCSGFDTPSIMSSSLGTIAEVLSKISFPDPKDLCTLSTKSMNYLENLDKPLPKNIRVVVFSDTFWRKEKANGASEEIRQKFDDFIDKLRKELNIQVHIYDFPKNLLRLIPLLYHVISSVESISNYANFTGLLFPFEKQGETINPTKKDNGSNFEEILFNNRSVFGDEFVFRQLMGSYFIDGKNYHNIYIKSKKILSKINGEVDKLFKSFDLIISPSSDDIPPKIEGFTRKYSPSSIKAIMILANLASLPAISIPWQIIDNMPVGLHIMSSFGNDDVLLNFSNHLVSFIAKNK